MARSRYGGTSTNSMFYTMISTKTEKKTQTVNTINTMCCTKYKTKQKTLALVCLTGVSHQNRRQAEGVWTVCSWVLWFTFVRLYFDCRVTDSLKMNNLHLVGYTKAPRELNVKAYLLNRNIFWHRQNVESLKLQLTSKLAGQTLQTNLTICLGAKEGRRNFGLSAEKIFLCRESFT